MLKITIPATNKDEQFDEERQEFIYTESSKEHTLELEHSLVSLSKWESKWCKPFLAAGDLTTEENADYIRCMSLSRNVDPKVFTYLTDDNFIAVRDYINAPMTATTITDHRTNRASKEKLTSELIYYYMIALGIPFECEKWHLNRLITLIRICSIKSESPKKMSKRDVMSKNAALNASRKRQLNTRG